MFLPIAISLIISSLFLNNSLSGIENKTSVANALTLEKGFVSEAMEKINDWPRQAAIFYYPPKNDLLAGEKKEIILPKKISGNFFDVEAESAIVIDKETETPLWGKVAGEIRSIASISKLMTALVFLENNPGWEIVYKIGKEDRREGARSNIYLGEEIKVKDLFNLSLVGSDNVATIAMVHSTGLSEEEFVEKMNDRARILGLKNTNFSDPVGLSEKNVSTAWEVARLLKVCLSNSEIKMSVTNKEYNFSTIKGRLVKVYSTDYLLDNFPENGINIIGGKTGYIEAAGFCFAGQFEDDNNREVISVILGARGYEKRFIETKKAIHWVYDNYKWE